MSYKYNNFNVFNFCLEIHNRSIYYAGEVLEYMELVDDLDAEMLRVEKIMCLDDGHIDGIWFRYFIEVQDYLNEAVDILEFFMEGCNFEKGCGRDVVIKALWKEMEERTTGSGVCTMYNV
jgi:hypothetical protein